MRSFGSRWPRSSAALLLVSLLAPGCSGGVITTDDLDGGGLGPSGRPSGSGASADGGLAGADGSTSTGGGPEAPVTGVRDAGAASGDTQGRVAMFVAQGDVGRTAISCDDGESWVADVSEDDALRCGSVDCDHHPGRARGIVYSDGYFVANFGWGMPGEVRRSADGVRWTTTLGDNTFGGIAGGSGASALLLGSRQPRRSTDDGATWSASMDPGASAWNVRRAGFVPHEGGRWILVFEDGDNRQVVLSSDGGQTFWTPSSIPGGCGRDVQTSGGIGYLDGTIVLVGSDGVVCRSSDGGRSWSESAIGRAVTSHDVVRVGDELLVYSAGQVHRSRDGASWSSTAISPASANIGAVARSPSGTIVAVETGWMHWYAQQRWYRSTDGVRFTELPESAARRGHPIARIAYGLASPSTACPAR